MKGVQFNAMQSRDVWNSDSEVGQGQRALMRQGYVNTAFCNNTTSVELILLLPPN
jgi:hypothetical protein